MRIQQSAIQSLLEASCASIIRCHINVLYGYVVSFGVNHSHCFVNTYAFNSNMCIVVSRAKKVDNLNSKG